MQYQEWLKYLVRKIAPCTCISPQDLGLTFDINRATGEVTAGDDRGPGLRPLLALVQDYFTREIVWDQSFGGSSNNLAFRFTRLNIKESMSKASINKLALAGMPWKPVNEARLDEGRPPLGEIRTTRRTRTTSSWRTRLWAWSPSRRSRRRPEVTHASSPPRRAGQSKPPKPKTPSESRSAHGAH